MLCPCNLRFFSFRMISMYQLLMHLLYTRTSSAWLSLFRFGTRQSLLLRIASLHARIHYNHRSWRSEDKQSALLVLVPLEMLLKLCKRLVLALCRSLESGTFRSTTHTFPSTKSLPYRSSLWACLSATSDERSMKLASSWASKSAT